MNPRLKNILKWTFAVAVLIYLFNFLLTTIQPVYIYNAQQPAFLSTYEFLNYYLKFPGGVAIYIGNFLSQFNYWNFTGSLVFVALSGLLALLGHFVFRKFINTGNGFLWMFFPVILAYSVIQDYYFPISVFVKVLFVFIFTVIYLPLIKKIIISAIYLVISGILLYFSMGSEALLVYSLTLIILSVYSNGFVKSIPVFVIALLFTIVVPYIGFKYFFNISHDNAYFDILPILPIELKYTPSSITTLFVYILPSVSLILATASYILDKKIQSDNVLTRFLNEKWYKWSMILIVPILLFIFKEITFEAESDNHQKNIVMVDYYTYKGEWNKTIDIAQSDPQYEIAINYNYNRAIYNTDQFGTQFFNYPQILGSMGLYPDILTTGKTALESSDFYYELGYISLAHRWAYEAQTAMPYNPRVLKRLIMTHLIERNYNAAGTFLEVLGKNFLYGDFVKKYKTYVSDTTLVSKDPEIMEKRELMPQHRIIHDNHIIRFRDLYETNPKNMRALEYMEMAYILDHKLGNFMKYIADLELIYPGLPDIYEQAMVLYFVKSDPSQLRTIKFSENTKNRFMTFNKTLKENNGNKEMAKESLFSTLGNTYFYYVYYVSPMVTKIKMAKREMIEQKQ